MTRRIATKPFAALLGALLFVSAAATAVTLDELQQEIDTGKFDAAARLSQTYLEAHPGNRDARFMHAREGHAGVRMSVAVRCKQLRQQVEQHRRARDDNRQHKA